MDQEEAYWTNVQYFHHLEPHNLVDTQKIMDRQRYSVCFGFTFHMKVSIYLHQLPKNALVNKKRWYLNDKKSPPNQVLPYPHSRIEKYRSSSTISR